MSQQDDKLDANTKVTLTIIVIFVVMAIVGTMETVKPATLQDQVHQCVIDSGAVTDQDIDIALVQCAIEYNYQPTEDDWV